MKILITGGMGYVGSHLIDLLLKDKHKIVLLTKSYSKKKNISQVKSKIKVEKIEKKQTMAFTLCYLSFFLALAIGSFVFISTYGLVSLSKTKRTRKIKRKNKKGRRK